MSKDKSATKTLSKKPTRNVHKKKSTTIVSKKKPIEGQNENPSQLLNKIPLIAELNPEMYGKLQSTIHEIVEKTLPEYKQWVNSSFGQEIIADGYPYSIKGGVSVQKIDQIVITAFNKAMNGAIRKASEQNEQPGIMEKWFKKKFYDDVSDIRPESRNYYKHYVFNFVTQFFSKEKIAGKKILDFGCGPGYYSTILAQRGAHVTGIDKSQFLIYKANQLKQKQRLENIEFFNGDFLDFATNLTPKQFDYIIAIDTIVSFDFTRQEHNHKEFTQALDKISRILKDQGRFFIIEAHPFFGQLAKGIALSNQGYFRGRLPQYKIEYKHEDNPNHWFTLDEMTKALSENHLAILRIHEPDPSVELEKENSQLYKFFLKHPHLIVYEICKVIT